MQFSTNFLILLPVALSGLFATVYAVPTGAQASHTLARREYLETKHAEILSSLRRRSGINSQLQRRQPVHHDVHGGAHATPEAAHHANTAYEMSGRAFRDVHDKHHATAHEAAASNLTHLANGTAHQDSRGGLHKTTAERDHAEHLIRLGGH